MQPQFLELVEVRLELHDPLVGAVNVKPLCTAGYVNPFFFHEDAVDDVALDEAFLFDEEVGVLERTRMRVKLQMGREANSAAFADYIDPLLERIVQEVRVGGRIGDRG